MTTRHTFYHRISLTTKTPQEFETALTGLAEKGFSVLQMNKAGSTETRSIMAEKELDDETSAQLLSKDRRLPNEAS